jgi:tetratricopeptide (TPR) repeat protein
MYSKRITQRDGLRLLPVVCSALLFLTGCDSPEERAFSHVTSAEAFLEEDNFLKAELEAKNALQIQPKNADARMVLVTIAESRGDFPEMAANLRAAIESRPDYVPARLKLGTLYALSGMIDDANAQLSEAEQLAPDSAGVRVLRARVLASQGDLEGAAAELQSALEIEPDNVEAIGLFANVTATSDVDSAIAMIDAAMAGQEDKRTLRLLKIQLLQRGGDIDAVDAAYSALVADYPEEAGYSYQYAGFLAATGKEDQIESVLLALVEREPENIQARLALVQFVAGNRGPEAGEAMLLDYLDSAPDAHDLRLVLARQYQVTEREPEAIAEYETVVELAGNEDPALTAKSRLAAIELANGDAEAGEALIEDVLSVDSSNAEALVLRGALNFNRNEFKDAVSDLRSVLRESPDNAGAQLLLARTHSKAEDYSLAKDAYRRALQMTPGNAPVVIELVRLLVREGELEEAETVLEQQIQQTPEDVRIARALIAILVDRERYDDALDEARRVRALEGQAAIGDFLAGRIYQIRGQNEAAMQAFGSSLELKPAAREPLSGYVSSLVALGRQQDAIAFLEKMGRDYPDNLYSKTLLGRVLAGAGETTAAREVFESTLTENQEWLPAYTALAGLNQADLGAQIDVYKRGLDAVPGSQELALLLGTAYERNGQYEDAISTYAEALRANPEMQAVANNMAALLADFRDDEASFEQALELVAEFSDSNNPAFLDTLGWVHYRLGDFVVAQPLLVEAVKLAGDAPVLRYHLGMNYNAQGKFELAVEQLRAATAEGAADYIGKQEAQLMLEQLVAAN